MSQICLYSEKIGIYQVLTRVILYGSCLTKYSLLNIDRVVFTMCGKQLKSEVFEGG